MYHLFNICGISLHPLTLSLVRNIFICALVGTVFPAYIIFKLHNKIPNFLSVLNSVNKDTRHFYQRPPYIEPRLYWKTFEILQLQSIQWSSIRTERCYIYDCTCIWCLVLLQKMKLPKIRVTSEKTNTKIIFVNECIDSISTNFDK